MPIDWCRCKLTASVFESSVVTRGKAACLSLSSEMPAYSCAGMERLYEPIPPCRLQGISEMPAEYRRSLTAQRSLILKIL